jgi:PAS domain S-box-containing protein
MTERDRPKIDTDPLALVSANLRDALDGIDLPTYVFDRDGTLRWANHATSTLIGQRVGQSFLSFVPADVRELVKAEFARKIVGGGATAYELAVLDVDGCRVQLRVRSAPLRQRGGEIVGVFGLAVPLHEGMPKRERAQDAVLTPRQAEVLRLLAAGLTTEAIAQQLGVARETVRNHIRGLLKRLGVHSRLEAVVEARQRGLLEG